MSNMPLVDIETHRSSDPTYWQEIRDFTRPAFGNVYEQITGELSEAENILDVAGGDGHTLDILGADFVPRLTVVDIDGEALGRLEAKYPDARSVKADANELPFEDETFDAAICIAGIESVGSQGPSVVREIGRVLKPGARFNFFLDLPYHLKHQAIPEFMNLDPEARPHTFVLPSIDPETQILDRFSLLTDSAVEVLRQSDIEGSLGQDSFKRLDAYLNGQWIQYVYGERLEVPVLARQFDVMVHDIEIAVKALHHTRGTPRVPHTGSLIKKFNSLISNLFENGPLTLDRTFVETDFRTSEPLMYKGQPVRRLRSDELGNAHIHRYASNRLYDDAVTRVQGRTPVYTATKS